MINISQFNIKYYIFVIVFDLKMYDKLNDMLQVEIHKNINTNQGWLINQFEIFNFTEPFLTEKFIPRQYISIVFNFRNLPLILDKLPIQLEPFFVGPIIPQAIKLKFQGNMDTFIVACKPTVFSRHFNINLSPREKRSVNLPHAIFYPLWKSMSDLSSTEERINFFTNFINTFHEASYCPDAVDDLYNKIIEMGTTTPLKEIMQDCCATERSLQRNFIRRTGVSPKTMMRIVRLNNLWDKIKNENAIDYQDLVFDGHYFDQSHFINDFKAIIGETPNQFFKRNLNIVKMFSGKAEGKI